MREQSRAFCPIIIRLLGFSIAFVIAGFNLLSRFHGSAPSPRQDATNTEEQDALVWSSEAQDWRLRVGVQNVTNDDRGRTECVWPEDRSKKQCSNTDRIIEQLKLEFQVEDKLFKIAVADDYSLPIGRELFIKDKCLVSNCLITSDLEKADAVVYPNSDVRHAATTRRRTDQIWIAHFLESPPNTFDQRFARKYRGQHEFNWTASYRSDADIVTPYARFVPFDNQPRTSSVLFKQKHRKLVGGKQNKVAWLVSNCYAKNKRLEYARELTNYIQVDIYGKCGNFTCSKWSQTACLDLINRNYKFYLAFENSNMREYITEKLYRNALGYNDEDHLLIPIVMGPKRRDYEKLAPPNSFIHVDDYASPAELAKYLKQLANDDELYYSYFKWKTMGKFIDTKFMCRVCSMLNEAHRAERISSISNIKDSWLSEEGL